MARPISDILNAQWDVIVIGTGIGGGTVGRALAEAGKRVLFLEKGPEGYRSEETRLDLAMPDPVARHLRGFWPDPVELSLNDQHQSLFAPLGAGLGGSSVFYAATLERPEPHDLDDSAERPHPAGGWPVSFAQMSPYFDRAARLFCVNGSPDPLSRVPYPGLTEAPPPPPGDAALMAHLQAAGLSPYQLHAAIKREIECPDCLGRKCASGCKMDGRSAGVEPALASGNAALLTEAEVTRIAPGSVQLRHGGSDYEINAPQIVLAAGALSSPRLLMGSKSEAHPDGLGNANGQIGHGLMFHLNEMFGLWPGREAGDGIAKSIGFRDLYFTESQRLGMVQAMGVEIGYGEILHHLRQRLSHHPLRHIPGSQELARIPAALAARAFGPAKLFVGLLEDLPYAENRVLDDPGQIRIEYRLADELLTRRKLFRRLIKSRLRGIRSAFLSKAPELNLGHPCGTLAMGADPNRSVTAPDGQLHHCPGIWVADASSFASSMGVNPSLTIAANALRVADTILEAP